MRFAQAFERLRRMGETQFVAPQLADAFFEASLRPHNAMSA